MTGTEDEALSWAQKSHRHVDSQCSLEKVFQQVLDPHMGF